MELLSMKGFDNSVEKAAGRQRFFFGVQKGANSCALRHSQMVCGGEDGRTNRRFEGLRPSKGETSHRGEPL